MYLQQEKLPWSVLAYRISNTPGSLNDSSWLGFVAATFAWGPLASRLNRHAPLELLLVPSSYSSGPDQADK